MLDKLTDSAFVPGFPPANPMQWQLRAIADDFTFAGPSGSYEFKKLLDPHIHFALGLGFKDGIGDGPELPIRRPFDYKPSALLRFLERKNGERAV